MTRKEFTRFVSVPDRLERHLRAAAAITEALAPTQLTPVVVGGSAVEFCTRGSYTSADLDLMAAYWVDLDWAYLHHLENAEANRRYAQVHEEARRLAERLFAQLPRHEAPDRRHPEGEGQP